MKSKIIKVKRGNAVIKIYVISRDKNGRQYAEYKVADKSGGTRRLLTFGKEADARQKAAEIAESAANGQVEAEGWTLRKNRSWRIAWTC